MLFMFYEQLPSDLLSAEQSSHTGAASFVWIVYQVLKVSVV